MFLRQGFSVALEPVLELALVDHLPASASRMLGLKVCATTTWLPREFLKIGFHCVLQADLKISISWLSLLNLDVTGVFRHTQGKYAFYSSAVIDHSYVGKTNASHWFVNQELLCI